MVSKAKHVANERWNAANLDRIEVKLRKGTKEEWKGYCETLGLSMAQLVDRSVREYIERNLST